MSRENEVLQSGFVTPSNFTTWVTDGVIADSGISALNITSSFSVKQFDNGTVSSGPAIINVGASPQQRLTVGGPINIVFSSWPASGIYLETEIELINGGANVTWPVVNWLIGNGTNTTTFAATGVTLNNPGTNWVIVWSRDGGATVWGRAA